MAAAGYSGALDGAAQKPAGGASPRWWMIIAAVCAIVVLLALLWTGSQSPALPGESSAEAGFARDMITHHAQAVRMALLVYERGEHETLRTIALDMLLTQQAQIGQMQGWLRVWGLPLSGVELPMTWMGMPTEGLMPGMASDEQLAALGAFFFARSKAVPIGKFQRLIEHSGKIARIIGRTRRRRIRHLVFLDEVPLAQLHRINAHFRGRDVYETFHIVIAFWTSRAAIGGDPAIIRYEAVFRIFCRDPALECVAVQSDIELRWNSGFVD